MPDRAAPAYEEVLKARPNDFIALAFAADFYRRADQPAQARKLYERLLDPALSAPAESVEKARRHLAVLLASDRPKALALLDDNARQRAGTLADERIRFFIRGQDDRARSDALDQFQESLRRGQPTPDERLLFAQMLETAGSLGQARAQLAEAVEECPLAGQYLTRYALILIRVGDLDEARRVIVRLETLEPGNGRLREVQAALAKRIAGKS